MSVGEAILNRVILRTGNPQVAFQVAEQIAGAHNALPKAIQTLAKYADDILDPALPGRTPEISNRALESWSKNLTGVAGASMKTRDAMLGVRNIVGDATMPIFTRASGEQMPLTRFLGSLVQGLNNQSGRLDMAFEEGRASLRFADFAEQNLAKDGVRALNQAGSWLSQFHIVA